MIRDSQLMILWMSGKGYTDDFKIGKHHHDFYQLQYLLDGEENISIAGHSYVLKPNFISLIDSDAYHSYSFNKESKLIDIKFNLNEELRNMLTPLFSIPVFRVNDVFLRNGFTQLIDQAIDYQSNENLDTLITLDTQVKLLLLQLLHAPSLANMPTKKDNLSIFDNILNGRSFPMLDFLEENYNLQVTLNLLSEKFHYSKGQIIKMFSDTLHQTPMQVLQKIRMQQAKYLLKSTDFSIGEIANMVGLSDNYLTKIFYKYENQLPKKYRASSKKNHDDIILNTDFDISAQP